MENKENVQPFPFKNILIVALILIGIFAYSDYEKTIDELKEQVTELNSKLDEKDEELEELTYEYEELESSYEWQKDNYASRSEDSRNRYWELYQEYDQLRFEKSIPVYHCEHSEDSIINLVYSYFDEFGYYLWDSVEYTTDDGGAVLRSGFIEEVDNWLTQLREAVDYDSYYEYQSYLYSKEIYGNG